MALLTSVLLHCATTFGTARGPPLARAMIPIRDAVVALDLWPRFTGRLSFDPGPDNDATPRITLPIP